MNNNQKFPDKKLPSKTNKLKRSMDDSPRDPAKLKAVAVKYDVDANKAPKIVAAGRGKIAESIVKLAEDNNVPLYEDPTLADLLSKLEVETEIPPELYTLVAEVLSFVYQLDKMAKKRETIQKAGQKKR